MDDKGPKKKKGALKDKTPDDIDEIFDTTNIIDTSLIFDTWEI